jgi:hypothetical protein
MALLSGSRRLVGLVAISLLASACGSGETAATEGTPEVTEATAPTSRPAPTDPAPVVDVSLATVAGGQLEWSSLAGTDVMLWFWAPW